MRMATKLHERAECKFAVSAITVASFIKVKISDFQTCFHDEWRIAALLTPERHAIKVDNRSGLT